MWTRFAKKTKGNNMTSNGKKLQKSAGGNTALDKESIVELMKTVFEEEFAKQQQQISKIIENNLVITKQEIGKLREEINDLKKSIEFTENVLEEKVANVEQNVCELQGKFKKVEEDVAYMNDYIEDAENIHNKLVELEDRSRRNNIRIDGIKEHNKESCEECERRVHSMLKERLDIENVEIERAHRGGRKSRSKPRTIVCKLLRFKDKQNILRKAKLLKGTNIFINEDYCQDTVEYRKELWEEVKVLRSQGKIAYLNYRCIVSRDKVSALSTETETSEY